ncbi:MAG: sensor histidine kinase [Pyrinomonadaceae bacterium]
MLNEDSRSVSRDSLVLIATIPFTTLILTVFSIGNEKFLFGKSHTYYDWVWQYLFSFIIQTVVSFSCISYFYVAALNKTKERLTKSQIAQSEMQLKILQQQVDPHFLFNNLNVLSSLIETNPRIANEFLERLAELYRYILQTQNVEVVPIKSELDFAKSYLYLIEQRFGKAYIFDWQVSENKLNGQMIVPSALQSLIENAVKHNAGNQQKPLQIRIELDKEFLSVENEIRPKAQTRPTSGTGLQNLAARSAFLTGEPIKILSDERIFKVVVPLIKSNQ